MNFLKKINWGWGIAITFGIFTIIVAATIIVAMRNSTDLVADNYYEKEMKYQDQINTLQRTALLDSAVTVISLEHSVEIRFPVSYRRSTGMVQFYRPSNKKLDFTIPLATDSSGKQSISTSGLERGYWKIQVIWKTGDLNYYREQPVIIQ